MLLYTERNEFHERSVDTNRRKNLGMSRLANTHQDKPELKTGLPPTTIVTVSVFTKESDNEVI